MMREMSSSCSVLHSFHERGSCKLIFRCVIIFGFLSLANIVQNDLAVRTLAFIRDFIFTSDLTDLTDFFLPTSISYMISNTLIFAVANLIIIIDITNSYY